MNISQDLRYALRQLRINPAFTTVTVLTLALGIGANTAIFTVVNAVLLSHLPVKHPEQLVFLTNPDEQGMQVGFADGDRDLLTYPEFLELAGNNEAFSGLLAASSETPDFVVETDMSGTGGEAAQAKVSLVSGSYFSVLGVDPILGRSFTPEVDKVRDANPIALISYRFWQDRFAGDPNVLGRRLRIHNTSFDIIGVASPQFHGETVGVAPDIWIPLSMQSEIYPARDFLSQEAKPFHKTEWLQVMGRLKPGTSLAQAKASINAEFQQLLLSQTGGMSADDQHRFLNQHLAVMEGSHGASTVRADFGKPLQILMAVVGMILLIACANVANLLLARSTARRREIAVRVAMGAGAGRLFREVLTQSILLASIGGAVGLLLAYWADAALLRMVSGGPIPLPLDVRPDAKVLAFTLGVSVLTGVLFGLVPALRAGRVDLSSVLKGTSRTVAGAVTHGGRVPVGKTLVVVQVALSVVLLSVAGLFVRSFQKLVTVQLGYDRDHLLFFSINPLSYGYKGAEVPQLYTDMLARIVAIPGVRGASFSDNGLLSGRDSSSPVTIEGEKPKSGATHPRWDTVGPNFFSATGIPLLYGREIGPQDTATSQRVGVINATFAREYFGDSNPIGRRARVHTTFTDQDFVIVGVVADSKHGSVREKPRPRFYIPFLNPIGEANSANILVRTSGDPSAVASAIREVVKQSAANLPPVEIETMKQRVADSLTSDIMITELAGAFGVLAVVLVCIGLYGIMAYAVSGRTNEIGLRMALGAQRRNVLWLILGESLLLVLIGVAIGLPVVFGAGKWIASLLFDVKPADVVTLAMATVLMFVVGTCACYIPARRAMQVDPMEALRDE
ncbi:MAG TPA: ABC transporter permease [Candidatus Sulfotelmatobacter sp.]|nr:ABC transporter permease [Candidatus Sulfotelmatobacter sp.]